MITIEMNSHGDHNIDDVFKDYFFTWKLEKVHFNHFNAAFRIC